MKFFLFKAVNEDTSDTFISKGMYVVNLWCFVENVMMVESVCRWIVCVQRCCWSFCFPHCFCTWKIILQTGAEGWWLFPWGINSWWSMNVWNRWGSPSRCSRLLYRTWPGSVCAQLFFFFSLQIWTHFGLKHAIHGTQTWISKMLGFGCIWSSWSISQQYCRILVLPHIIDFPGWKPPQKCCMDRALSPLFRQGSFIAISPPASAQYPTAIREVSSSVPWQPASLPRKTTSSGHEAALPSSNNVQVVRGESYV